MLKLTKKNIFLIILIVFLVVGVVFLYFRSNSIPVKFIQSSPVDKAVSVSMFDPITIEFNNLTPSLQSDVNYKLEPDNKTFSSWTNSTILTIKPSTKFNLGTNFKLLIYYKNILLKQISFTTKTIEELSPSEVQANQTIEDYLYSQQQQNFLNSRPWAHNLPIDNNQYEAVDDSANNAIFVRIRDNTTNIDILKSLILKKLISIGVPSNYNIEWILP